MVITEELQQNYSTGDCWLLAIELSKLTGWSIHWAGSKHGLPEYSWCHAFVETPEGYIVDIDGVSTPEEFHNRWRRKAKSWACVRNTSEYTTGVVIDPDSFFSAMRPRYKTYTMAEEVALELLAEYKEYINLKVESFAA